jgi:ABC-2 type transport system permease protein
MRQEIHAEWTKARTGGGTGWVVLATIVATVGISAIVCAATQYSTTLTQDPTKISLIGINVGQVGLAALAIMLICNEYATGMIRVTLGAMPRRLHMLAAKATVVTGLALVTAIVSVLGSLLVGRLILSGNGFTTAHGFHTVSLLHRSTWHAAAGSIAYLTLVALLSVGTSLAARDAAAAIATVLAAVFLFPILAALVTDPHWARHLQQLGPLTAGLAQQATVPVHDPPLNRLAGLGVITAWTSAALVAGSLVLSRRDA